MPVQPQKFHVSHNMKRYIETDASQADVRNENVIEPIW